MGVAHSGAQAYLASMIKGDVNEDYDHADGWESTQDAIASKGSVIVLDGQHGRITFRNGTSSATTSVGTTKTTAEAMSIGGSNNAQYVGIGLENPTARLQVYETGGADYAMKMSNTGNHADRGGIYMQIGANDGTGTTYYIHAADGDGSTIGYLQHSGDFDAVNASDIRLKEDVVDTSINGLNLVNAMKIRDFKWKKSGDTMTAGLIANELKEVFPLAVTGTADATYEHVVSEAVPAKYDIDGNLVEAAQAEVTRTEIDPMCISRAKLIPVLIKAVQELTAKVTALENA